MYTTRWKIIMTVHCTVMSFQVIKNHRPVTRWRFRAPCGVAGSPYETEAAAWAAANDHLKMCRTCHE
jgi:hypothetical protein